jgi:hypothetical protein
MGALKIYIDRDTGNHVAFPATDEVSHRYYALLTAVPITAVRTALAAAGYAVVPVQPTEAQHDAARDWSNAKYGKAIGKDASDGCYRAMLAAAGETKE